MDFADTTNTTLSMLQVNSTAEMTITTTTTTARLLQSSGPGGTDGPVAILIIVCILFCFIW